MRKSTRIAATVASAGLIAAAMAAPASAARPDWSKKSDMSIKEKAIALSTQKNSPAGAFDNVHGDFDILINALVATGVADALNGPDYTVFAPTDQAFMDATRTTTEKAAFDSVLFLFGEGVADVLKYHVTEGVRNSNSVSRAKQITMLNGGTISARGGETIKAANSQAGFVATDVRVSDGMIHVIDFVLLP